MELTDTNIHSHPHIVTKKLTHGETLAQEQTTALVSSSNEVARVVNFILPCREKGKYKYKYKSKAKS